tara:strand:- start:99 stop:332 length:234 start_codon:yes stop_codon:yes gene_type:complete
MIDEIWKRDEIDSPCIKLCILHSKEKICLGCYRTADEIKNWSKYSDEQRTVIKSQLKIRGSTLTKRRGGRNRHKEKK